LKGKEVNALFNTFYYKKELGAWVDMKRWWDTRTYY